MRDNICRCCHKNKAKGILFCNSCTSKPNNEHTFDKRLNIIKDLMLNDKRSANEKLFIKRNMKGGLQRC